VLSRPQPQVMVPISGIERTEERRIEVIVTATGRPLWVPRSIAQFAPGRVFLPQWFYRKIQHFCHSNRCEVHA